MTADLGADERRIRRLLRERGVGPDAITIPPMPGHPPTIGVAQPEPPAPQEPPPSEEPAAEEAPARQPWRSRLPNWRRGETLIDLTKHDDETETEAADEEPEQADDDGQEETEGDEEAPTKDAPARGRKGRSTRPASPKAALADLISGLSPKQRWGLYCGSAAAAGWLAGAPQFVTAEIAYLVATHRDPGDVYCLFWYAVAAVVLWADWKTRSWWPPLAWVCRIPAASLVLGALLYARH